MGAIILLTGLIILGIIFPPLWIVYAIYLLFGLVDSFK